MPKNIVKACVNAIKKGIYISKIPIKDSERLKIAPSIPTAKPDAIDSAKPCLFWLFLLSFDEKRLKNPIIIKTIPPKEENFSVRKDCKKFPR